MQVKLGLLPGALKPLSRLGNSGNFNSTVAVQ
jgi:hypothetical protein